jgi:hypothetical protein
MTTPRLGAPELTSGQAIPETTVNEIARTIEQGAGYFIVKDKDTLTPPGSPTAGDAYIIAGTGTGEWASQDQKIAFRFNSTAWNFITPIEGTLAWVQDEDEFYRYSGSAWASIEATNSQIWAGSAGGAFLTPANLYTASAPVALTSGATITPDGNNGFNFTLTIAENATLANPSNFKTGQSGLIVITQDGTGSRTLSYGTNWKFPGGSPVLSTAAGSVDVLAYYVVTSSLYVCTLTKAYSS